MPLFRCHCGTEVRISPGRMIVLGDSGLLCPGCGRTLGLEPPPVANQPTQLPEDDSPSEPSDAGSLAADSQPVVSDKDDSTETLEPVATFIELAEPHLPARSSWHKQAASWSVSLMVHVTVLTLFAVFFLPTMAAPMFDQITIDTAWTPDEGSEAALGFDGDLSANMALSSMAVPAQQADGVGQMLAHSTNAVAITEPQLPGAAPAQMAAAMPSLPTSSLMNSVRLARLSDPGKGGLVQGQGAGHATEGILGGIRKELEDGPVQVVWLMDASVSMNIDRPEVAAKLQPFYKEMSQRDKATSFPLVSSVVRFGAMPVELVRTTKSFGRVTEAIAALQDDPSGLENVMTAVQFCLRRHMSWKGTLIIVVWTDESGDDILKLEETISMCRAQNAIVHVVGPNAVFGSERGTHLWRDPGTGLTFQLPVKRGPETSLPERLMIPYWHGFQYPPATMNGQLVAQGLPWFGGSMREGMLSGFGPYALTRLALQTGGTFTVLNRPGDRVIATLDRMRPYMPDYSNAHEYYLRTQASPLRRAISDAALFIWQAPKLEPPPLTFLFSRNVFYPFSAYVDYRNPQNFRPAFRENLLIGLKGSQAELAILQKALELFEAVNLEPEYDRETSPRWKAWYDLNYGRLLANSVRHLEYQLTCEQILRNGALNADTNHVVFVPSREYKGGRASAGRAALAWRLLERCRANNPGTPWDLLAEWELNQDLGLDAQQIVIPPPRLVQAAPVIPTPPTKPIPFPKL